MLDYDPEDFKTKKDRMLEKEMELVEVIRKCWEEQHHSPSMKELTAAVGFKSSSTTHRYLLRLKSKGMVTWEEKKRRTLNVLEN